jgi:hypothetical protein
MKALIFLMLFAPLSNLLAQDWTYLTTAKNGNKQYYKKHSENVLFKKIWIKEEGNNLQRVSKNNKIVVYSGYNLSLYNVDCRDRKIALMQVDHYNNKDIILSSSEGDEFKWSYMSPGSIGDMIINAACAK